MIRLSRDIHQEGRKDCSPDTMSIPYICLIALVAVTVGVSLAWIG